MKRVGGKKPPHSFLSSCNNSGPIFNSGQEITPEGGLEHELSLSQSGSERYGYDGFNRLVAVTNAATSVSYTYRPDGLRYGKMINSTSTQHLWDGGNIIVDFKNGAVESTYLRGSQIISSGSGSSLRYYMYNGHGDVVQLVNTSGQVVTQYDYDAFGNQKGDEEDIVSDADKNSFRYCAEYFDKETQVIYLRNRYYNSAYGRFTQEDPIRSGLNWYSYCGGNPVGYMDPLGLAVAALIGKASSTTIGSEASRIYIHLWDDAGNSGTYVLPLTFNIDGLKFGGIGMEAHTLYAPGVENLDEFLSQKFEVVYVDLFAIKKGLVYDSSGKEVGETTGFGISSGLGLGDIDALKRVDALKKIVEVYDKAEKIANLTGSFTLDMPQAQPYSEFLYQAQQTYQQDIDKQAKQQARKQDEAAKLQSQKAQAQQALHKASGISYQAMLNPNSNASRFLESLYGLLENPDTQFHRYSYDGHFYSAYVYDGKVTILQYR